MAAVLTGASTLACPHDFLFKVTPSQQLFTVDDQFLVVRDDLLNTKITTCTNNPACTAIALITAGLSTTLAIDGGQVVLETAKGTTNVGPWRVKDAGQDKLEAQ